jgi:2-octaprenyl-6-methoxyphenol hydroxylase
MSLSDREFLAQVQERFGYRLGRFQRAGKRASYPLSLVRAKEHIRPGVALIGNAAHSVHPITGQGFNLGIRDVAVLAEVLVDANQNGRGLGALETLKIYADWRQRDQQAVSLMTDGLVRLFGNPLLPVRIARDLGMLALDLTPPLKHLLTRQFMGINGRLPRLARGLSLAR